MKPTFTSKFTLQFGGFSHVGLRREHNEDAFCINPELRLALVADGMGGHNSGEIASKMAIETIEGFYRATSLDDEITWPYKMDRKLGETENRLRVAALLSNDRIWETSRRNELYHGMGTTIIAAAFDSEEAVLANVGDSRCYLFRSGELVQVSVDHSLLNETLKHQSLTPEEIQNFPHKNVIVRAVGIKEFVEVDLFRVPLHRGDVFLLCSDGLTDMVPDTVIADILLTTPDLTLASKLLIREANERGGMDNVTAALVSAR